MSEENITKYVLMNKNTPVLEFEYDLDAHVPTRITGEMNLNYAPPYALNPKTRKPERKRLLDWWTGRIIPASRDHLRYSTDSIAGKFKGVVDMNVIYELVEKNFGLSLSDQYWVNNPEMSTKWDEVNFFHNKFSDDVGNVLLGVNENLSPEESKSLDLKSPNGTVDGALRKCWKIVDGKRLLFKNSDNRESRVPYNEVIASELFKLTLEENDFVKYDLFEDKKNTYSVCKNMLTDSEELIPAEQIVNFHASNLRNNYQSYVLGCEEFGIKNYEEKLSKMIACDFIIANEDRHLNNFGIIRNVETLECKIAPIYDNGTSLFYAAKNRDDIASLKFSMKAFVFNSNKSPIENLKRFAPDLSWFDAGRLKGFSEKARAILESSQFAKERRPDIVSEVIDNICYGLKRRIDFVRKRQLELSRTQVNLGSLPDNSLSEKPSVIQKLKEIEDFKSEPAAPAPIKLKSH